MSEAELSEIEERMRKMAEELDALPSVDETPKTTLGIIGRGEEENYWNSILRYFLDPNEPHGLDAELLKEVLNRIPFEKEFSFNKRELEDAQVVSEPQMEHGRADIAVYVEDEWFVLFELKVGSGEGENQTRKYADSDEVDGIPKDDFDPSKFYVFVSKSGKPSEADDFVDISWKSVVDATDEILTSSKGRYPTKTTAQLMDFKDSIDRVITMTDPEDQRIQEEKTKTYAQYSEDIDTLKTAVKKTREREVDRWYDRFVNEFKPEGWTEDWNCRRSKWGQIYRDDWWLDENGKQTKDWSDLTYFVHFRSLFWKEKYETFSKGDFQFNTMVNNSADDEYRHEFKRLCNNKYRSDLKEIISELDRNIELKRGIKNHTEYIYTFDATKGTDEFYKTLRTAFEDHVKLAPVITEVHQTAVENVTDGEITF